MVLAQIRLEEEQQDEQMQILAWQTALLMNSSGNFKKKIRPKDLYTPISEVKEKVEHENLKGAEVKKQLQEELLSAFADSDVINNK